MAILAKATLQRLAVLHALSQWRKGAFGNLRVQKTLYFADLQNDPRWHLFTFKKWRLGQYSDDVANALNSLKDCGRLNVSFDGPADRIGTTISAATRRQVDRFFRDYFPQWHAGVASAFRQWAYLRNDTILKLAHEDPSYKESEYGTVILQAFSWPEVDFVAFSKEQAERLTDLVDPHFHSVLRARLREAAGRKPVAEDWRSVYFSPRAG